MTTTPRTASTSDARERKAERLPEVTADQMRVAEQMISDDAVFARPPADQPPALPDTSGWVKRAPGDVIEAGTPYVVIDPDKTEVEAHFGGLDFAVTVHPDGPLWTPPPAPREPWRDISTDRDQPTLAKVTSDSGQVVTREWWRSEIRLNSEGIDGDPGEYDWIYLPRVTDVELLRPCPVTHMPVERALIDEAARAKHVAEPWGPLYDVVNALAALADGAESNGGES